MTEPDREEPQGLAQMIEADAMELARKVLGRDPNPDEAEALKTIFRSTAQALSHGFIKRLADHVTAERTEESIEEFFEGNLKTD